jgi:broad specificity phosphatase PhoE
MTRILITRHGQAEHNLNTQFFMGRSPLSRLTDMGRDQARRLGQRLLADEIRPRIVCSSLLRTVETAGIVASALGADAPEPDDAFWELNKGDWEGRMPRALPPEVKREVDADPFGFRHPNGESYRDVLDRVAPAFERWLARYPDATLLFVLHGDVIRALLYHLIGFPPARIGDWVTDPCALNEFQQEPGGHRLIVRLNDGSHLA